MSESTQIFYQILTSVHRRRGLNHRPSLAVFILIILSFIGATLYWAAMMAAVIIQIRSVLVKNDGMDLSEKIALSNVAMAKPFLIEIFAGLFMVS